MTGPLQPLQWRTGGLFGSRSTIIVAGTLVSLLCAACPTGRYAYEGDDRGECDDGADNDRDGAFDCDDPDCEGSPDCEGDGGTGSGNGSGDSDDEYDNVATCEEWLENIECGDYDFGAVVSCEVYAQVECDATDYFDCLTENTACDDDLGIVDTTGWSDCTHLTACG